MAENTRLEQLLQEIGKKHRVSDRLLYKMLEIERSKLHLQRRRGVTQELRLALAKELNAEANHEH